jgi:hypothetical protein
MSADDKNKTFVLRNVPDDVHKQWKIMSTILGMTMESLAVEAIVLRIKQLKNELESELHTTIATTTSSTSATNINNIDNINNINNSNNVLVKD